MNDTVITVSHAKDDLWRSVVARHHVRCHHETCAGGTSQAKVKDLQGTVTLHHDVGRLQVLRQQTYVFILQMPYLSLIHSGPAIAVNNEVSSW